MKLEVLGCNERDIHIHWYQFDKKKTVKNLCDSQKHHRMHFFFTFICNQNMFLIKGTQNWLYYGECNINYLVNKYMSN